MPHNQENSIRNRTFSELFSSPISFEIPFFQRAYSWERPQWKQLLDDIEEQILDEVIGKIIHDANNQRIEPGKDYMLDHEHYFGAIVVLEKRNNDPQLKCFSVIDGQQRITTVYLLLGVIQKLLKGKPDLVLIATQKAQPWLLICNFTIKVITILMIFGTTQQKN
jgi:uncharacterized protein with ParB-like and HNH nuclease domain